ncbi:MAG: hypothetical protein PHF63_00430 [Herbinix sp.]|nr:hypothetical protein [Herbinix sp.]
MIQDNEYEIVTDTELNLILNELPFDVIKESIVQQFKDRLYNSPNYISIITTKCNILRNRFPENDEVSTFIDESLTEFCEYILKLFSSELGIEIDGSDFNTKELVATTVSLYNIYIVKYNKKMIKFLYNYIKENSKSLTGVYDKPKKDVTTVSAKKKFQNNKEAVLILSNLFEIITDIINENNDTGEVFDFMSNIGDFDFSELNDLIKRGIIVDDLVEAFYEGIRRESINSQGNVVYLEVFNKLSKYYNIGGKN